jgi:acetyl-CoA synthetase
VLDQERFHAQRLLQAIEKYKITSFCAPPTVYRYLVHEDIAGYDLSSLEWCTTAGEALNPSVFERFKAATGLELHEGFGQTETTMTLGTMPWVKPKPGSMGLPNPQYDIVLLRRDGTLCDDNENGEICVRTEIKGNELRAKKCNPQTFKPIGLFREYFGDPELTKQVWHDGIYHTGDVAYRDEDGYYWFVGRTDDVIKSSGYRIGPFEVESALMCHPAVVECAITGVPDEFRGMVVKATIVLRPDWKQRAGDELIKELQEHVKRTTAPYKYPRIIDFVDALPKTISGKIRRVEIREQDANERNKH